MRHVFFGLVIFGVVLMFLQESGGEDTSTTRIICAIFLSTWAILLENRKRDDG